MRHLMMPCSHTSWSPFSAFRVSLRASVRARRLVFSSNTLRETCQGRASLADCSLACCSVTIAARQSKAFQS